jgi:hypothetical protein
MYRFDSKIVLCFHAYFVYDLVILKDHNLNWNLKRSANILYVTQMMGTTDWQTLYTRCSG